MTFDRNDFDDVDINDDNDVNADDAKPTEDGTTTTTFEPEWLSTIRIKNSKTFSDLFHDSFNEKERRTKTNEEQEEEKKDDDQYVLY
jgi:hypothetical protein